MFGDEQIEEEGEEKVDWGDQEVDKRDARLVNQQDRKDQNVIMFKSPTTPSSKYRDRGKYQVKNKPDPSPWWGAGLNIQRRERHQMLGPEFQQKLDMTKNNRYVLWFQHFNDGTGYEYNIHVQWFVHF